MVRVCGVFGTWQLITLVAALRQADREGGRSEQSEDVLVMYETAGVSGEFKEVLRRMAHAAWPWKRVASAYDLLTNRSRYSEGEFTRTLETLRERVGAPADEVDEIWTCWLTRPAERLLFEAFPKARIVLYEDGLITYLPLLRADRSGFAPEPPRALLKRVRHLLRTSRRALPAHLRFRYSKNALDVRHLARVSGAYLQLGGPEPLDQALHGVPTHRVGYGDLGSVVAELATELADALRPALVAKRKDARPRILVLGQALSRNGIMSRASELELYRGVVERVLAKGYSVLWKEHPRVREPFFPEIAVHAAAAGQEALVEGFALPQAYPIELVAPGLRLAGCVVGISAAPFYLKRLYGLPCYTFADDLLPHLRKADVFMAQMVRREVDSLADLPASGGPAQTPDIEEGPGTPP